jgi:integrase
MSDTDLVPKPKREPEPERSSAHAIRPPKVEEAEVETLKVDQVGAVLEALDDHPLHSIGVLALSTGARRGEILSLRWCDVDMTAGTLRIERSLEQTKAGLKFKAPKTKHGRRTVALPPTACCGASIVMVPLLEPLGIRALTCVRAQL